MSRPIQNILIADDDLDDIDLFSQALTEVNPGVTLNVAGDGNALINLLNICTIPDIIVLDLNMPYKTGKQCLREIRLQQKFNMVPVILMSTSRHVTEVRHTITGGLNYFSMKPWTYPDLKLIINKICEGRYAEIETMVV